MGGWYDTIVNIATLVFASIVSIDLVCVAIDQRKKMKRR